MSLASYNIIEAAVPSYGWTFPQKYNGTEITLKASSAAALVTEVEDFRINVGLPLGDIEGEIAQHIASVSPSSVRLGMKVAPINAEKANTFKPMIERIKRWFAATIKRRVKFCDKEEAERRAAICAACTQNVTWRVKGCGSCNEDAERRSIVARCGKSTSKDEELKSCRTQGTELRFFVWFDIDELPEVSDKSPSTCWLNERTNRTTNQREGQ